jgi:hypothetical protein
VSRTAPFSLKQLGREGPVVTLPLPLSFAAANEASVGVLLCSEWKFAVSGIFACVDDFDRDHRLYQKRQSGRTRLVDVRARKRTHNQLYDQRSNKITFDKIEKIML